MPPRIPVDIATNLKFVKVDSKGLTTSKKIRKSSSKREMRMKYAKGAVCIREASVKVTYIFVMRIGRKYLAMVGVNCPLES